MARDEIAERDEAEDPATEAFEALRTDVLTKLDNLAGELKGPDYSRTLGKIVQTLQAIESHPALSMTPQRFAQDIREASEVVRQQAERELNGASQQLNMAVKDLTSLVSGVIARRDQNRLLGIVFVGGAVLGMVQWVCLSGPVARVLPASWAIPEKMAAATLNLDRWSAGERLMQTENPDGFKLAVVGDRVALANRAVLADCEAAARRFGKAQRCVVTVVTEPASAP